MEIVFAFIILILSVIAHEVAHGYAANALGDPTARLAGRLTLNPIPHIDLMGSIVIPAILVLSGSPVFFGWAKPVPYNPYNLRGHRWGETLVALAGVATNLLFAIIFGLIVRFGPTLGLGTAVLTLAYYIALINLFLGLFNLIPFPPLDGFTALRSALPWHLSSGFARFEARVRSAGFLSLLLFLLVFFYVLADPFYALVLWLLTRLVGG